ERDRGRLRPHLEPPEARGLILAHRSPAAPAGFPVHWMKPQPGIEPACGLPGVRLDCVCSDRPSLPWRSGRLKDERFPQNAYAFRLPPSPPLAVAFRVPRPIRPAMPAGVVFHETSGDDDVDRSAY